MGGKTYWQVAAERSAGIRHAEVAKKRSRRVVDIPDALAVWLANYAQRKGPVVDKAGIDNATPYA